MKLKNKPVKEGFFGAVLLPPCSSKVLRLNAVFSKTGRAFSSPCKQMHRREKLEKKKEEEKDV